MTIIEFITARLAEDEARATAAQEYTNRTPWVFVPDPHGGHHWAGSIEDEAPNPQTVPPTSVNLIADQVGEVSWGEHIAANDPDAALRRCTLIRAMLRHAKDIGETERELNNEYGLSGRDDEMITEALMHREIAAYWNTHPDYRNEWPPTA